MEIIQVEELGISEVKAIKYARFFDNRGYFTEDSQIEYLCTGEYSPGCEAGISPFSDDIDWSLCDKKLKEEFVSLKKAGGVISEKDKGGFTLEKWLPDKRSENFVYGKL